jgi:hypothetical protein
MKTATELAQKIADQELDACCDHLKRSWCPTVTMDNLRAARRPKPSSLKEQALTLLDDASDRLDAVHENTIRRALESLPD